MLDCVQPVLVVTYIYTILKSNNLAVRAHTLMLGSLLLIFPYTFSCLTTWNRKMNSPWNRRSESEKNCMEYILGYLVCWQFIFSDRNYRYIQFSPETHWQWRRGRQRLSPPPPLQTAQWSRWNPSQGAGWWWPWSDAWSRVYSGPGPSTHSL